MRDKVKIGPIILLLLLGLAGCGQNKFQREVDVEASGAKLVREVQRGEYDFITTEELKELIDNRAELVLIDAMPYEDSYKKQHILGAKNFLFPIEEDMPEWDNEMTGGKTKAQYEELLGPNKDKQIVV